MDGGDGLAPWYSVISDLQIGTLFVYKYICGILFTL